MRTYEHRQISPWIVVAIALVATAFLMYGSAQTGFAEKLAAFALVMVIVLPFSSLSTRVDERGLSWSFAFGFPNGFIPFVDIEDAQITTTKIWEGFGIHWTIWHGWLWNVSGFRAVTIHKRNRKLVTIGTDDPQGLYDAIEPSVDPAPGGANTMMLR
jgi:hypothetical protein